MSAISGINNFKCQVSFINFITTVLKWKIRKFLPAASRHNYLNTLDFSSTNPGNLSFTLTVSSIRATCIAWLVTPTTTTVCGLLAMPRVLTMKATLKAGSILQWEDLAIVE